jgi:cyclopropane fatty-acyl-phospholipid synthase-like methyltransferase
MPGAANPASQVLVVGCGFGWIIETIVDTFNHNRIWGTEVSPWIQAEKATNARPDIAPLILDIDILAADARTQLRTAGAGQQGRFDWIISEQAVEGIPAVDLPTFLDACDGLLRPGGNVVHVVATEITPPGPDDVHDRTLDLRWQSHAAWIAERPAHLWLDVHGEGGWVMGGGV